MPSNVRGSSPDDNQKPRTLGGMSALAGLCVFATWREIVFMRSPSPRSVPFTLLTVATSSGGKSAFKQILGLNVHASPNLTNFLQFLS